MPPGIGFRTNGDFAIHVTDLDRADAFYGSVLGFRRLSRDSEQIVFDTGVVRLYVNKDTRVVSFIPALEVPGYEEAKKHLVQSGCTIVNEFPGHKALYFTDPFGITIDIIERAPVRK